MPASRGPVTAHITRISQDNPQITTLVLSEAQMLELITAVTTGLREKAIHADGFYHLAIWKDEANGRVKNCQANPACAGGAANLALVCRGKS
jgi:hypothetical protein